MEIVRSFELLQPRRSPLYLQFLQSYIKLSLQLGLGRLKSRQHEIPDVAGGLVEVEAHLLLNKFVSTHPYSSAFDNGDKLTEPRPFETTLNCKLFSLIIYAMPQPSSITWLHP
jgi:hypothetical protein